MQSGHQQVGTWVKFLLRTLGWPWWPWQPRHFAVSLDTCQPLWAGPEVLPGYRLFCNNCHECLLFKRSWGSGDAKCKASAAGEDSDDCLRACLVGLLGDSYICIYICVYVYISVCVYVSPICISLLYLISRCYI